MKMFYAVLFTLAFFLGSSTRRSDAQDVTEVISRDLYETMFKHRNRFYSYDAFVAAARSFNGFGTTGDFITRKRELAAFFGQTSHETT
ncbi:Glycoside hydrolase, family 19, catalytic, partial [Corchorus olitorius]